MLHLEQPGPSNIGAPAEGDPAIDVIVHGEGEVPFAEIAQAWGAGGDLDEVSGISFRRGEAVVSTAEAAIVRDLNLLPSPHTDKYMTVERRVASVETQRGCVFRCNFCFYNKDMSIRNRRFDLDRVKSELLYWLNRDVVEIYLMDPIFNLNATRAKEICRFIAKHNTRRVQMHAAILAEFMDDELASLMAAANMCWLEVGLQTTDDTTLQAVERRLRMTPFLEGIEHLKRHKLYFELQLIFGLPFETPETFRRSLNFAASLEPSELSVFILLILPGTELWTKAAALGISFDPNPLYTVRSHPSMSADDIAEGTRNVDVINGMGASRTIHILQREPGLTMSVIVDAWNAFRDGRELSSVMGNDMKTLVTEFCHHHGGPPSFYAAMIELEYGSEQQSKRRAPGDVPRPYPEHPSATL